jgi:hypothetical protein
MASTLQAMPSERVDRYQMARNRLARMAAIEFADIFLTLNEGGAIVVSSIELDERMKALALLVVEVWGEEIGGYHVKQRH